MLSSSFVTVSRQGKDYYSDFRARKIRLKEGRAQERNSPSAPFSNMGASAMTLRLISASPDVFLKEHKWMHHHFTDFSTSWNIKIAKCIHMKTCNSCNGKSANLFKKREEKNTFYNPYKQVGGRTEVWQPHWRLEGTAVLHINLPTLVNFLSTRFSHPPIIAIQQLINCCWNIISMLVIWGEINDCLSITMLREALFSSPSVNLLIYSSNQLPSRTP